MVRIQLQFGLAALAATLWLCGEAAAQQRQDTLTVARVFVENRCIIAPAAATQSARASEARESALLTSGA